jgi:hypothetical protein
VAFACACGKLLVIKDGDGAASLQHDPFAFQFRQSNRNTRPPDSEQLCDQLMRDLNFAPIDGEMRKQEPTPDAALYIVPGIAEPDIGALHQQCLNIAQQHTTQGARRLQGTAEIFGGHPKGFSGRLHDCTQRCAHSLQDDRHAGHSVAAYDAGPEETIAPGSRLNANQPGLYEIGISGPATWLLKNLSLADLNSLQAQVAQTPVRELP